MRKNISGLAVVGLAALAFVFCLCGSAPAVQGDLVENGYIDWSDRKPSQLHGQN